MEVQAREQCPKKCSVCDSSMRPRNPFTGEGHHGVAVLDFGRHAERGVEGSRVVAYSSTHAMKVNECSVPLPGGVREWSTLENCYSEDGPEKQSWKKTPGED